MKITYLILFIAGTVVPYVFFFEFFTQSGFAPVAFVSALFVNGAAGGFAADVIIASVAFWVWLVAERAPKLWMYIALNLLVGLSSALPLYLYLRSASAPQRSAVYSG